MSGYTIAVRHIAITALRGNNGGTVVEISDTLQTHTNQPSSQSKSNRFVLKFSGILFGLVARSYETCSDECTDRNSTTESPDDENDRC